MSNRWMEINTYWDKKRSNGSRFRRKYNILSLEHNTSEMPVEYPGGDIVPGHLVLV